MQAGRMRYRLRLLHPVASTDKFGAEKTVYELTRTVHAERVKTSSRRSEEVGEHFPDYNTEFNIRAQHPIDENWRVEQIGGHIYTVTNIVINIERGMQTLICERVNE